MSSYNDEITQPLDPDDAKRVNECAALLNVTAEQLLAAAAMVGYMPRAIECYLQSKGRRTKVMTASDRARSQISSAARQSRDGSQRRRHGS